MRRVTALMSAAAFVVATAGVFAQAKPNFTGKWMREAPAAGDTGGGGRGGGRGGGFGQEANITQDATTLTIEYMGGGRNPAPTKLVYKLDGSESMNTMPGRGGGEPTQVPSKAAWVGNTLVITTAAPNGERKQVLSLDGGKLVVETTAPGREGAPTTSKVTYTKGS